MLRYLCPYFVALGDKEHEERYVRDIWENGSINRPMRK